MAERTEQEIAHERLGQRPDRRAARVDDGEVAQVRDAAERLDRVPHRRAHEHGVGPHHPPVEGGGAAWAFPVRGRVDLQWQFDRCRG